MNNKKLLEIHAAVFLFGLAGLFAKLLTLDPVIIVLGRVLFASMSLLIIIKLSKQSLRLSSVKDYLVLSLMGLILAIHWITFFKSIQVSTVAVGLLTYSTFPIFVTFIEPYFFKEKIRTIDIVIAIFTLAGVAIVIPEFNIDNNITQGALWGVMSGFTFAVLAIMNRKYVKRYSSLVIAFYQDTVATIVLLPFLFAIGPLFELKDIFLLVLLGVVFTALAHSLFIRGLSGIKAQLASIIACLEPVYGILFAFLFLNEVLTLRIIIGGLIILIMTFIATLKSNKPN